VKESQVGKKGVLQKRSQLDLKGDQLWYGAREPTPIGLHSQNWESLEHAKSNSSPRKTQRYTLYPGGEAE